MCWFGTWDFLLPRALHSLFIPKNMAHGCIILMTSHRFMKSHNQEETKKNSQKLWVDIYNFNVRAVCIKKYHGTPSGLVVTVPGKLISCSRNLHKTNTHKQVCLSAWEMFKRRQNEDQTIFKDINQLTQQSYFWTVGRRWS